MPRRRCTPAPNGRMTTAATRSLEIAAEGVTPNSRISIGVISAPPPAPVRPTRNPTTALPSTMYGSTCMASPTHRPHSSPTRAIASEKMIMQIGSDLAEIAPTQARPRRWRSRPPGCARPSAARRPRAAVLEWGPAPVGREQRCWWGRRQSAAGGGARAGSAPVGRGRRCSSGVRRQLRRGVDR